MQFAVLFLLLFGWCRSAPHVGLPLIGPDGIGGIFKGPDSETIIRGPDGSEITSEQKGGAVVQEESLIAQPIVAAEPLVAPAVSSTAAPLFDSIESGLLSPPPPPPPPPISYGPIVSSTAAPLLGSIEPALLSPSTPLLTGEVAPIDLKPIEIVQQDPHIIETEIIEAPDVEPEQSSDLKGPSGRIITQGSASVVSGPASTTITEPRRIILAPPKVTLETPLVPVQESSFLAPIPSITASTVSALPAVAASTVLSTTVAPLGVGGYTGTPWAGVSSTVDSSRIDLGGVASDSASVPLVDYSSSNGVINGLSTAAPLISSTITTGLEVPASHLVAPQAPVVSSDNIQRISRLEDTIPDGRVDMGTLPRRNDYKLPRVLSLALSRFYSKAPSKSTDLVIDDKMGELTQNEIAYDVGPQINLEQVPLSPVPKISGGGYHSGLNGGWGKK